MQLFDYQKQTQRLLREQRQDIVNPGDIVDYINRARRETAQRAECIRRITPISGQVVSATVQSGGTGYSNTPVMQITPPDFPSGRPPTPNGAQATASAIVIGGVIQSVNITFGGDGYFKPVLTIIDPTGSGAQVTLTVSSYVNVLNPNQEQYNFSDIDLTFFPGVSSVYTIRGVSVIYANYRYSLPMYSFSVYQAKIRQYPFQYTYVPVFCSQLGQGSGGNFFVYPWPSQTYQWEFDLFCLPQDLVTNGSVDAIPSPWDDVVPFYAAHLGLLDMQEYNRANYMLDLYDKMLQRKSNYARPGRLTNPYGRW